TADALFLAPLALTPVCSSLGIFSVGLLQMNHQWKALAKGQLVAAVVSVAASVPVVVFVQPILGATLQTFVSELVFALWAMRVAAPLARAYRPHSGLNDNPRR